MFALFTFSRHESNPHSRIQSHETLVINQCLTLCTVVSTVRRISVSHNILKYNVWQLCHVWSCEKMQTLFNLRAIWENTDNNPPPPPLILYKTHLNSHKLTLKAFSQLEISINVLVSSYRLHLNTYVTSLQPLYIFTLSVGRSTLDVRIVKGKYDTHETFELYINDTTEAIICEHKLKALVSVGGRNSWL